MSPTTDTSMHDPDRRSEPQGPPRSPTHRRNELKSTAPGSKNYGAGENSRPEIHDFVPSGIGSLLDVGCAGGLFGEALRRSRPHLRVDGVEPQPDAAEYARTRLDTVYPGFFPQALPSGAVYDCITFLDVLEHLIDPWEALREARRHLTAGGFIIVSIPNIRHIDVVAPLVLRGRFAYTDFGILDRTHLRFFTKNSALEMVSGSGYSIQKLGRVRGSLGTGRPYWLIRNLGRLAREFTTINYVIVATCSSDQ